MGVLISIFRVWSCSCFSSVYFLSVFWCVVCVCVCVFFFVLVHLRIFLVRFGVLKASFWLIALYGSCLCKRGGRGERRE